MNLNLRNSDDLSLSPRAVGMTFIEIILVIAIIGISMSVAIPMLTRKPGNLELRTAAETVQSLIRYTRNSSIVKAKKHKIRFDRDKARLVVEAEESPIDSPGVYEKHKLPTSVGREIDPKQMEIVFRFVGIPDERPGNEGEILFYPDGSSSDTLIYVVNKENGRACTIALAGATGISFLRKEIGDLQSFANTESVDAQAE